MCVVLRGQLSAGQFSRVDGQRIVSPRIECVEQVNPVKDLANKLFQKQSRDNPDFAPQFAGNGIGERMDISIVGEGTNAIGIVCMRYEDVPDLHSDLDQGSARKSG